MRLVKIENAKDETGIRQGTIYIHPAHVIRVSGYTNDGAWIDLDDGTKVITDMKLADVVSSINQMATKKEHDFTDTEIKVIATLYERPGGTVGTTTLVSLFRPGLKQSSEEGVKLFNEVSEAVETLIMLELADGKRFRDDAKRVFFDSLVLTRPGEKLAIELRKKAA